MESEKESREDIPTISTENQEWKTERSTDALTELDIGDWVEFTKRISEEDVERFARASGDTNRLHLDSGFAEDTRFASRIVHGTLLAGLVSAALARLPGTVIFLSEEKRFLKPGEIGGTFTGRCTVCEIHDDRYHLETEVTDQDGNVLIDGTAMVLLEPVNDDC